MNKLKNEKGVITIIVLISVLFFLSFLISSYVMVSNKVQTQKEIIKETKNTYENYDIEEIYNNYFGKNLIPIYSKEQLLAIGNGTTKLIDNNYYNFVNDEQTIYILKNDIEIVAYEEETLKNEQGEYYWTPIGQRTDLLAKFEGNGHKIKVKYKDSSGEEYTIIYDSKEGYKEKEYKIKVIPKFEDGTIATNAFLIQDGVERPDLLGMQEITVKRLEEVKVSAKISGNSYQQAPEKTIKIENPNKIENEIELILKSNYVQLTINTNPAGATVVIDGKTNPGTIKVLPGQEITYEVSMSGYDSTGQVKYKVTTEKNQVINVTLNKSKVKVVFTIQPTPADAVVKINGVETRSVELMTGDTVSWSISKSYYQTETGTFTAENVNHTINIYLKSNPVQTLVVDATGATGDVININNAIKGSKTSSESAYKGLGDDRTLTWTFSGFNEINSNAIIQSMTAEMTLSGTGTPDAQATLRVGSTAYGTWSGGVKTIANQYAINFSSYPTAAQIKTNGISIAATIKKVNILSQGRWYGATVTIQYINP